MILVSVCLPSDAFSQCLLSYLGLSYLGCGVAPLSHAHGPSLNHQVDRVNRSAEVSQCPSSERQSFILLFTGHLLTLITSSSGSLSWLYFLSCSIGHTHYIPYLLLSLRTVLSRKWKCYLLSHVQLFSTPWTVAYHAPLSMGFSRQEYWSGLPFPIQGSSRVSWVSCIGRQILYYRICHKICFFDILIF